MNRQEFEEAAKRYREEMFRLYAGRQDDAPSSPSVPLPPPPQEASPAPEPVQIPAGPEETAVKPESDGGILVHVRTARGVEPVAGAAVLITSEQDGMQSLISVQITDESGDVPEVRVPAPPSDADQQHPAYSVYGISVYAEGYYREHSTDVPVFEGVVSVQNFDLIPLPAGADDPFAAGRTHYNDMT